MSKVEKIVLPIIFGIMILGFVVTNCISAKESNSNSKVVDTTTVDSTPAKHFYEWSVPKDTIVIHDTIRIYKVIEADCGNVVDSLRASNAELNKVILRQNHKLARIRDYVRISNVGKNSKYLKGWIIRVLNH